MLPNLADIDAWLAEDVGSGDITAHIIPEHIQAEAAVIARECMVLCGQAWVDAVFHRLNPTINISWQVKEGDTVKANTLLCKLKGQARSLLTGERTALNILQTLSATASMTKTYTDAVKGTGCKILDTRKTIPGLRLAQKYAVQCGGGVNHRIGLYDAVLIKENHILTAGSIANAVAVARQQSNLSVEVEVESLDELRQAIAAKPNRIMLDNFSLDDMRTAVAINNHTVELEASGNITLDNIRTVAETGVDYISIGALTKNIKAIDLSMRIKLVL